MHINFKVTSGMKLWTDANHLFSHVFGGLKIKWRFAYPDGVVMLYEVFEINPLT